MLNVQHLSVKIGQLFLLQAVSLSLNPGEVLAVVGANGAGKSTLLKALCGDVPIYGGQVMVNDKTLSQWRLRDLSRIRAVLPQQAGLSFPFTALEVVLMGRSPHQQQPTRDREISQQAMSFTETAHLQARRYTTLSGGERQRVHFARVLAQIWQPIDAQPRYLLLDEPTSALDLAHQHSTLKVARHFAKQQGVGVLAILHDLNLAAQYADRIAVLKASKLLAIDTPQKVLNAALIEQTFGYPVLITQHPQVPHCPVVVPQLDNGRENV